MPTRSSWMTFKSQNYKLRRTKRWQSCFRFHANCITYCRKGRKTCVGIVCTWTRKVFAENLLCRYEQSAFHVSFILFNFNCMCKVVLLVQNEVTSTESEKEEMEFLSWMSVHFADAINVMELAEKLTNSETTLIDGSFRKLLAFKLRWF